VDDKVPSPCRSGRAAQLNRQALGEVNAVNGRDFSIVVFSLSLVPYAAVAWALTHFNVLDIYFWRALGLLLLARLFFALIEAIGGVLIWRLHNRKRVVEWFVHYLRSNSFPKRIYYHDDFLNYLVRVEDDEQLPIAVRKSARELEGQLATFETMGVLIGARMHAASELALEIYSPRAHAPTQVL
jgi:hypothetical protein